MKILVVDDEINILTLLKALLVGDDYEVVTARDGEEAFNLFYNEHFDMLIIDEMMPKISGNEVVKTIRKDNGDIPIIMVTAKSGLEDKAESFNSGVDDYLTKPIVSAELLMRIKALFRRAKINVEKKIVVGETVLDYQTHTIENKKKNLSVTLTKTEFELLYKLLSYPEKIFTKWQLLEEFWGVESDVTEGIVKSFIFKVRKQIEPFSEIGIQTVMGIGYRGVKNEK